MLPPQHTAHTFWSDASGSWGCGALTDTLQWFQVQWPKSWRQHHTKEIVPVVIAIAVCGPSSGSTTMQVFSDNIAVVSALRSGSARDPLLMHLLCCLHFFCAYFSVGLQACHITGFRHTKADARSRDMSKNTSPASPRLHAHRPECHNPCWTCYCTENQTGHHKTGGHCFSVPYRSTSSRDIAGLWVRPSPLHHILHPSRSSSLPLTEHKLCVFVVHLGSQGLSHQTIKSYCQLFATTIYVRVMRIHLLETHFHYCNTCSGASNAQSPSHGGNHAYPSPQQ